MFGRFATTNVAADYPEVVAALAARYQEMTKLGRSTPGQPHGQRPRTSAGDPPSKK